ncbi:response regulator [Sulfuriroseicoccus oceanibius]|uniref:Response regulator n=1 Tax=Sulfuriroseicoccus oceanibius TaxID=2707525 RepID=A0A6B3LER9_9BACT|nr:response regulator [Sulfuriroseicoccus oceanibius]QQL44986.1 response regulator [Sulfuriroseicoccus oceanibius]
MAENEELPDLMTVKETSQYLRIPLPTVYYLVQRQQLPAVQIGGRWRIKRKLLDRDILKKEEPRERSVMLIDTDEAMRVMVGQYLTKSGVAPVLVKNAEEAIGQLAVNQPDLILLDLNQPDLAGDELYTRIRKSHPDVPLFVISGHPDGEVLWRIMQAGPVTMLRKPIHFEHLEALLKMTEPSAVEE